jgi:hypothetical protein
MYCEDIFRVYYIFEPFHHETVATNLLAFSKSECNNSHTIEHDWVFQPARYVFITTR